MYIRLSINADYNDKEKGVDLPDIEISKEFEGRVPTNEEIEAVIAIFKRCLTTQEETTAKPKVRELGSA